MANVLDDLLPRRKRKDPLDDLLGPDEDRIAPEGKQPLRRNPGRPRGSTNKPKAPSLKESTKALLEVANWPISMASADDMLTPDEIDALAQALVDDPWTAKYLVATGKYSTHMGLVIVSIGILIPRLVRHGIIPTAGAPEAAFPVETGGAYGSDWRDGLGQDDARVSSVNGAS